MSDTPVNNNVSNRELVKRMEDEIQVFNSQSLQRIVVLQLYHQVNRIIKYLDLMDNLEDKLYESIEYQIGTTDIEDGWALLLKIQSKLQENMIESQKLLKPYIDIVMVDDKIFDIQSYGTEVTDEVSVINAESRESIRRNAKDLLNFHGGKTVREVKGKLLDKTAEDIETKIGLSVLSTVPKYKPKNVSSKIRLKRKEAKNAEN